MQDAHRKTVGFCSVFKFEILSVISRVVMDRRQREVDGKQARSQGRGEGYSRPSLGILMALCAPLFCPFNPTLLPSNALCAPKTRCSLGF